MSEKANFYRSIVSDTFKYWAFDSEGNGDQYTMNFSGDTFLNSDMRPSPHDESYVSTHYDTITEGEFMEEWGGQNAEYAANTEDRIGGRPHKPS